MNHCVREKHQQEDREGVGERERGTHVVEGVVRVAAEREHLLAHVALEENERSLQVLESQLVQARSRRKRERAKRRTRKVLQANAAETSCAQW